MDSNTKLENLKRFLIETKKFNTKNKRITLGLVKLLGVNQTCAVRKAINLYCKENTVIDTEEMFFREYAVMPILQWYEGYLSHFHDIKTK